MVKIYIPVLLLILFSILFCSLKAQNTLSQRSWKSVATEMPDGWYGSAESKAVAENVLLYQRKSGGWPKNTPFHKPLTDVENAKLSDDKDLNDAIFDNGATTTEMKFMAKMFNNTTNAEYKSAFIRGLNFILRAQYDNGGWPMFFPLRKGYYTHITFNDNAIVNILDMLSDINNETPLYSFIAAGDIVKKTKVSFKKGIISILKTQIIVNGKPTVWCAQHDENTLLPAKARSYELPSFSGAESIGIVKLLMSISDPTPEIIKSVKGAIEWLQSHKIENTKWEKFINEDGLQDRRIVSFPGAGDLWARFYDLETGLPFFCDRDGIKKKSLQEIGYERRNGYSWYTTEPQDVINMYIAWKEKWVK